ncbi:nitrilase family protein [Paenarthrobacter histidinolovorans]|uniref:Amidohydrolase n=1 Tax=Paenarthrobacter histidinolovorans TaxID=43664 RepID=A0ABW8N319_9MICC|nr:nitrilase family protein [Paenarthrobacter histidinolovorans]GGJ09768.1 hydrolase [Paenarthrobacter histidinolovorans]
MSKDPQPTLRASAVQFEAVPDRPDLNLETIRRLATAAAAGGSQLIAFPEMCLIGYWHLRRQTTQRLMELAEPVDGPSVSTIRALALQLEVGIGVGHLETDSAGRLYNSYTVCLPDGKLHTHRKIHAFEHDAVDSGSEFTVFDTPWGVKAGILICWDNNLVENVRATALLGASVLLAPHQTGGTNSRSPQGMKPIPRELWEKRTEDPAAIEDAFRGPHGRGWLMRWLPSRAHDNGIFILFSNGVGRDDDEIRTGNSMIIDPYGTVITETWAADEAIVTADLDLALIPLSTGRRWLRGRRPDLYGVLTQSQGNELAPRAARFSSDPVQM